MSRSRRGMYIWLLLLGLAVTLIAAGTVSTTSAPLGFAVVLAYIALVLGTLATSRLRGMRFEFKMPQMMPQMAQMAANARQTPAARKASQRARGRPGYNPDHTVADVGLIVNRRRSDGRWNRYLAQNIARDEGAVQPYVTIFAPSQYANRVAVIDFDIYDQAGRSVFNHTMQQYIRDGENLIACERQLPMQAAENASARNGVWDLRVAVDGAPVAFHSFNVTPANTARRLSINDEGEAQMNIAVPEDEQAVSLDDLLREQRGGRSR